MGSPLITSTPLLTYSLRLRKLLTTEKMNEIKIAIASANATSEGLLYVYMIFFMTNRPRTTPIPVNNATQSMYIRLSLPKIKNIMADAPEDQIIR